MLAGNAGIKATYSLLYIDTPSLLPSDFRNTPYYTRSKSFYSPHYPQNHRTSFPERICIGGNGGGSPFLITRIPRKNCITFLLGVMIHIMAHIRDCC